VQCTYHIFLSKTQQGALEFVDCIGMVHVHALRFESFPKSQRSRTLHDCIMLGKRFVMKVIDFLNTRFINLPIFNVVEFIRSDKKIQSRHILVLIIITRIWMIETLKQEYD
jgi:hypothetical protein